MLNGIWRQGFQRYTLFLITMEDLTKDISEFPPRTSNMNTLHFQTTWKSLQSGGRSLAAESANSIWSSTLVRLHVARASRSRKQYLYIGLTNANLSTDEVIVQLSPMGWDLISIHMNKFNEAISTDPDFSAIPTADHAKILQALY